MEGTEGVAMTERLTRADVERIVAEAHAAGVRPNLQNADLHGTDLRGLNLRRADLLGAKLSEADLLGADLCYADLRDANVRYADMRCANLWGAHRWGCLPFQAGASGNGYMVPTPDGWRITIGCWEDNTLDDLRDMIDDRAEWPEASGGERERRRPMLRAVIALCEAHIAQQPENIITRLHERWGG